jgi:hypothetical protein
VNLVDVTDEQVRESLRTQAAVALAAVRKEVDRLEDIVEGRLT